MVPFGVRCNTWLEFLCGGKCAFTKLWHPASSEEHYSSQTVLFFFSGRLEWFKWNRFWTDRRCNIEIAAVCLALWEAVSFSLWSRLVVPHFHFFVIDLEKCVGFLWNILKRASWSLKYHFMQNVLFLTVICALSQQLKALKMHKKPSSFQKRVFRSRIKLCVMS